MYCLMYLSVHLIVYVRIYCCIYAIIYNYLSCSVTTAPLNTQVIQFWAVEKEEVIVEYNWW